MLSEDGILYIHVPKTGGTSIETLLGSRAGSRNCFLDLPAHSTIEEYEGRIKAKPNRLVITTVSSIRNPYDRFFSFWLRYIYIKNCLTQARTSELIISGISRYDFKRNMTQWFLENYSCPPGDEPAALCSDFAQSVNDHFPELTRSQILRLPLWNLRFNLRPNLYKHYYSDDYSKIENFILFENLANDWYFFAKKMYENYRIQLDRKLPHTKHRGNVISPQPRQMYHGKEFHDYLLANYNWFGTGTMAQFLFDEKMMATLAATPQGYIPKIDKINLGPPAGSYEYYSNKSIALFEKYNHEDIEFYFDLVKNRSDLPDDLKKKCLVRPSNTTLER